MAWGMSMRMRESYARAIEYDKRITKKLGTKIFKRLYSKWVRIEHNDGSRFLFANASMRSDPKDRQYLWVFAEHSGIHVFAQDDLDGYEESKAIEAEKSRQAV